MCVANRQATRDDPSRDLSPSPSPLPADAAQGMALRISTRAQIDVNVMSARSRQFAMK